MSSSFSPAQRDSLDSHELGSRALNTTRVVDEPVGYLLEGPSRDPAMGQIPNQLAEGLATAVKEEEGNLAHGHTRHPAQMPDDVLVIWA